MKKRMALAALLLSAMFIGTGRAQDLSADGCPVPFPQDDSPPGRFHVTWVKDAHGEAKAVRVPVRELRIARLNFAGQTALPEFLQEEIADSLTTRSYDDDKEGLNDLRWRIVDAWQQQGYFRARVDLSDTHVLDESADVRTMEITATVQAGKQYRLEEIKLGELGSGSASPSAVVVTEGARFSAAELRALFLIQQGDIFDTHKIQQGIAELRKAYGTRGFINMTVVPTTQWHEATDRINVNLEIEEGKQFRIGKVDIVGNDRPPVRAFLESLGIAPGKIFNASRVEEFERRSPLLSLPDEFKLDAAVRTMNESRGTVDLTLRIDTCPAP